MTNATTAQTEFIAALESAVTHAPSLTAYQLAFHGQETPMTISGASARIDWLKAGSMGTRKPQTYAAIAAELAAFIAELAPAIEGYNIAQYATAITAHDHPIRIIRAVNKAIFYGGGQAPQILEFVAAWIAKN